MNIQTCLIAVVLSLPTVSFVKAEKRTEKIANEKVSVVEVVLTPGERARAVHDRAAVFVFLSSGSIEFSTQTGTIQVQKVERGEVRFLAQDRLFSNAGNTDLKFVHVGFVQLGGIQDWGRSGLAASYKLLNENRAGRTYEVKIPAGATEPQHTHHDRVVICLSGAELEHVMPDGKKEVSSLKTDEIVWRAGATHVGRNVGKTDLWVICIEPK